MLWFFKDYLGQDGFLGTRASLVLDLVVTAMLVFVPVMTFSIWLVKYRRLYRWHKAIQIALGIMLVATVVIFEIEVRITGWSDRARASPYWVDGPWNDCVDYSLGIHLLFAIPTPILWLIVIAGALRRFPRPLAPASYSQTHTALGWLAAAGMCLTVLTGVIFYWMAFVASS